MDTLLFSVLSLLWASGFTHFCAYETSPDTKDTAWKTLRQPQGSCWYRFVATMSNMSSLRRDLGDFD